MRQQLKERKRNGRKIRADDQGTFSAVVKTCQRQGIFFSTYPGLITCWKDCCCIDCERERSGSHQQKIFYLMYYIHIFLYPLVIPFLPTRFMPLIFPFFSQSLRGLQKAQNIFLASSILCLCPTLLAYSTGKCTLQHRPLFFFGSSPLAMLAIVRLICACVHPEKPTPVWCASHLWRIPSPLISLSPWRPLVSPLSCSSGHWFPSKRTNIRFSLYLFYSQLFILVILLSFSRPLIICLILLYFLYHLWLVLGYYMYHFMSLLCRSSSP